MNYAILRESYSGFQDRTPYEHVIHTCIYVVDYKEHYNFNLLKDKIHLN